MIVETVHTLSVQKRLHRKHISTFIGKVIRGIYRAIVWISGDKSVIIVTEKLEH